MSLGDVLKELEEIRIADAEKDYESRSRLGKEVLDRWAALAYLQIGQLCESISE